MYGWSDFEIPKASMFRRLYLLEYGHWMKWKPDLTRENLKFPAEDCAMSRLRKLLATRV